MNDLGFACFDQVERLHCRDERDHVAFPFLYICYQSYEREMKSWRHKFHRLIVVVVYFSDRTHYASAPSWMRQNAID